MADYTHTHPYHRVLRSAEDDAGLLAAVKAYEQALCAAPEDGALQASNRPCARQICK